jgi:hypothetical protein
VVALRDGVVLDRFGAYPAQILFLTGVVAVGRSVFGVLGTGIDDSGFVVVQRG